MTEGDGVLVPTFRSAQSPITARALFYPPKDMADLSAGGRTVTIQPAHERSVPSLVIWVRREEIVKR